MTSTPRILVLGGGFAALEAAFLLRMRVGDQTGVSSPAHEVGIGSQEIFGRVTGAVFDRVDEIEAQRPPEQAQILQSHLL